MLRVRTATLSSFPKEDSLGVLKSIVYTPTSASMTGCGRARGGGWGRDPARSSWRPASRKKVQACVGRLYRPFLPDSCTGLAYRTHIALPRICSTQLFPESERIGFSPQIFVRRPRGGCSLYTLGGGCSLHTTFWGIFADIDKKYGSRGMSMKKHE